MTASTGKAKKIIMLGLDGADPVLIEKYLSEGKLPNFQKVLAHGVTTQKGRADGWAKTN